MIYSFSISTPKNTLKALPQKTTKNIEAGILILKYIILPPGCMGLVGVSIRDAIHHLWPKNEDGWFIGEGLFAFEDRFPFYMPPYVLDIHTYNEDDTYSHAPIIVVAVERSDQIESYLKTVSLSPEYQGEG